MGLPELTTTYELYELASGRMRLVFEYEPTAEGYGYSLHVPGADGAWKRVSATGNPLVRGRSFDLYPSTIEQEGNGTLSVRGSKAYVAADGRPALYEWSGELSLDAANEWIHVRVTVCPEQPIGLQMIDGVEPEITIDMGDLPPYDRGDHVWFKTNINNPTKWNDEAYGNDFPAFYYFDSYHQFEVMMFFDMTAMEWMNRDNVARFLNYRCGFRRAYKPHPVYELGMYADGFSGKTFPSGRRTFAYSLSARRREDVPTEQTALVELVARCLTLVPAKAEWPAKATDWQDFAEQCAVELMDEAQCWGSNEKYETFILNYVNGYSPAWEEAFAAKGQTIDFKHSPCIDSAAFIGFPLSVVNAIRGADGRYEPLLAKLLRFMGDHIELAQAVFHIPSDSIVGTWQYVYILEQLWQSGVLNGDERIVNYVIKEVDTCLIPFARGVDYLFPLSFQTNMLRKYGNGDNYPVGGLYAMFLFNLYKHTGNGLYLEEAKRSLRPLCQMPVNSLAQESFLLATGVQAASWIYRETGEARYREAYDYLLAQTLRMMYWYDDNTKDEYKDYNIFGMFQACTPIIYPAFFENIEVLCRIAPTLDVHVPAKGLLRVFNHARINNFYMFPECLPENKHQSNLMHIPFENLGVLEDEKTGWIGQEIYGSGHVFAAYLMWEAYGKCSDRDVMALCLNNHKFLDLAALNGMELQFIVYNPAGEAKEVELTVADRFAVEAAWSGAPMEAADAPLLRTGNRIALRLEADEAQHIKVACARQ